MSSRLSSRSLYEQGGTKKDDTHQVPWYFPYLSRSK